VQTANVLMPDPWIVRPGKKRGPVPAKERALVIISIENPTMRGATLREIFLSEIGTKFLCKNTGLVLDGVYLFFALLLSPEIRKLFFQELYSENKSFLHGSGKQIITELNLSRDKTLEVLVPLLEKLEQFLFMHNNNPYLFGEFQEMFRVKV